MPGANSPDVVQYERVTAVPSRKWNAMKYCRTIDLRRGRLLRTVSVGVHPVAMAADERAGRVFILNKETSTRRGTVNVLAATTGQVLKIIAVGYQPSALAVDEPTGHVFVTSQSASVPGHGAFAALIERVQEFMAVTKGSSRGIVTILNVRT